MADPISYVMPTQVWRAQHNNKLAISEISDLLSVKIRNF